EAGYHSSGSRVRFQGRSRAIADPRRLFLMAWFEVRPRRLAREQGALAALVDEGWVTKVEWKLDAATQTAHVDVDFSGGGQLRQARLEYPFIYPGAPPRLVPRQKGQRWSAHQWGYGELC